MYMCTSRYGSLPVNIYLPFSQVLKLVCKCRFQTPDFTHKVAPPMWPANIHIVFNPSRPFDLFWHYKGRSHACVLYSTVRCVWIAVNLVQMKVISNFVKSYHAVPSKRLNLQCNLGRPDYILYSLMCTYLRRVIRHACLRVHLPLNFHVFWTHTECGQQQFHSSLLQ